MKILVLGDFYSDEKLSKELLESNITDIFGNFNEVIHSSDLAIVNLESPLTDHKIAIKKTGPALKAHKEMANFLKNSGFGLATLANNHILDYGPTGLFDTFSALNKANLDYVGAGKSLIEASKPYIYTCKEGKRLAILNFAENEWSTTKGESPGAVGINPIANFYEIHKAKQKADFVLVITHGGHENFNLPSKEFKSLLRFFVSAGADAVINHHTHHISGYEVFNGKPIYYSLGNFLFPSKTNKETFWNKGLAVKIDFSKAQIETSKYFFRQGLPNKHFELLLGVEEKFEADNFEKLTKIIQDDHLLDVWFKKWMVKSELYYKINIEPHSNRILQAIQNRNLLPSLWSDRKKLFLLNMLRCESHREMLIKQLEDENSHTKK